MRIWAEALRKITNDCVSIAKTVLGVEEIVKGKSKIRAQILEDMNETELEKDARAWRKFNSAFREPIDWRKIEYMAIKEAGKEVQVSRMG